MERIESIDEADSIILMDHYQRYQWACSCAYGTVLDVACGIGYGSKIIVKNSDVKKYIGIDIDVNSIEKANSNYRSDNCSFHVSSVYDLSFIENESVDTIITFETIEHLSQPYQAMQEFKRILKKDGILLGSVPTKELDEHHDKYHGGNKYHLVRYGIVQLEDLLAKYFASYNIYLSRMMLSIETHLLKGNLDCCYPVYVGEIENIQNCDNLGNYLFLATNNITINESFSQVLRAKSSIYLGPTNQGLYSQYHDMYGRYIETTNLYQKIQQYYDELVEKHNKLRKEYVELLNTQMR